MFVDRVAELAFLQRIQQQTHPGPGQLFMVYGRRRIGKTTLLRHWAETSGLPWIYWTAQKEPAALQRRKLYAAIIGRSSTDAGTPTFGSWSDLWHVVAPILTSRKQILILDELPNAAEADPAMLSALQHAWDRHFQHAPTIIALCGSQVRAMEMLLASRAPLFGRMTGQWHMQPLPFGALRVFLPHWSAEEQITAYALVGGIPTYLHWFDPQRSLADNLRERLLVPGSLILNEVEFLLNEEVREPRVYLSILQAIGNRAHTLGAISAAALIAPSNLSAYLAILQERRLVERRVPAAIAPPKQRISKQGRYYLCDPFHRFYFRFLQPNEAELSYQPARVLPIIEQGLPVFVGETAWKEVARQWVRTQARNGTLGFLPEQLGSHWDRTAQADVVAVSWQEQAILIGTCSWESAPVDKRTAHDFLTRTVPQVLADLPDKGSHWKVVPALFIRSSVTPAARTLLQDHNGLIIDVAQLWHDLAPSDIQPFGLEHVPQSRRLTSEAI